MVKRVGGCIAVWRCLVLGRRGALAWAALVLVIVGIIAIQEKRYGVGHGYFSWRVLRDLTFASEALVASAFVLSCLALRDRSASRLFSAAPVLLSLVVAPKFFLVSIYSIVLVVLQLLLSPAFR
jgi:hypothetical protein